ncbi:MAG TPA: Xaa-Pro aminopeptidase [Chthoniobacteraceae bacterium]|nr:Xaa-Pro aminopeptidase [Chthoniobacteraceae bacterium]
MRYAPIDPQLFVENRARLKQLLPPRSLAVLNANDILPSNADGVLGFVQNSDLFYLTGVDQEETILMLFPDAAEEKFREILFLRETNDDIATWEGHKLTKDDARKRTGIKRVHWLSEFPMLFRGLMCEAEHVFLNSNEHKRAHVTVETRDARFARQVREQFPLHDYQRLARLMHQLRVVKSAFEIDLIRKATALTARGFERVLKFVRPGVNEVEIEAELAHEFIRGGGGFAYGPIIASGPNACVLHYVENDQRCKKGRLLLLDVAASYANYRSDLTRTIPVSGRFSRRQRQVYDAVLRVLRGAMALAVPGKMPREWQKESEAMMEKELVELGLLKMRQIRKQDPERPALKKYFMHGIGHPLGLDVHDVGFMSEPMQAGWVLTVEPGVYIKDEGLAVRLENDIVVGEREPVDLMAEIPIEADEIERRMRARG